MNAERMTRNAWTAAYLHAALDNIKEYGASADVETAVARAYTIAYNATTPYDEKLAYNALLSAACGPNAEYRAYYDTDSIITKKNSYNSGINLDFAMALRKAMGGDRLDPLKTYV